MIDIDRAQHLRTRIRFGLLCIAVCACGVVCNELDITWPSSLILGAAMVLFTLNVREFASALREMKIAQPDKTIHKGGRTR